MKKHATTILLFLIMFVGLGLLLYPPLADWYNSFHQSRAIARYTERVGHVEGEDYAAYKEAARAYNEGLVGKSVYKRAANPQTLGTGYDRLLQVDGEDSGIIAILEIPRIALTLPIYHGTSDTVLQVAVGHLQWTSLPVGGEGTHCAFSAHRGLPSAKLFTNLDLLEVGDIFTIRVLDEVLTYQIVQIPPPVEPHELDLLEIEEGRDLCSLITCTPYGVNSHRLIVRGERLNEERTEALAARVTADATELDRMIVSCVVAAPILVALLVVMLITTSPKRKKKKAAAKRITAEDLVRMADEEAGRTPAAAKDADVECAPEANEPLSQNNEEGGERP